MFSALRDVSAGSHWEQRVAEQELMAPIVNAVMKVSPMTLALLADSGWYDVDYTKADEFATGVSYGYHQGCEFATESCLSDDGVSTGNPPYFCRQPEVPACTVARYGVCLESHGVLVPRFVTQSSVGLRCWHPTAAAAAITTRHCHHNHCTALHCAVLCYTAPIEPSPLLQTLHRLLRRRADDG
jgi:hypothetical protein